MIPANQLRIGNNLHWLHEDQAKIVTLDAVDILIIDRYNRDPDSDEFTRGLWYEEINLSIKLFEYCGLQRNENYTTLDCFDFDQDRSSIKFYNCGKYKGLIKIIYIRGHEIDPQVCKHVHQLQNLFFDLTGEELPIVFKNNPSTT
jgi:hypothetical protein